MGCRGVDEVYGCCVDMVGVDSVSFDIGKKGST